MKQRIITAAVILSIFIAVLFLGKYAFLCFILILAAGAMYEYNALVAENKSFGAAVVPCLLTVNQILSAVFYPKLIYVFFVIGVLTLFIIHLVEKDGSADRCVYSVWGYIYVALFMSLAVKTVFAEYGYYIVLPTILAVITCDSAAFFVGTKFGKHKLCPNISPKKSVEGAIAGLITAVIVFALTMLAAGSVPFENKTLFYLTGGIIPGTIGQLGDLAASLIKRKYGVKDYGNIFPGHGGFLDRIDSELFSLAAMYVYAQLVINLA